MNKKAKDSRLIADGIIRYLKNNHQENLLAEVIKILEKRLNDEVEVRVISAVKMNTDQQKKAAKLVERITKNKGASLKFEIDKNIIDGLKIIDRDMVWDLSMVGKIKRAVNSVCR